MGLKAIAYAGYKTGKTVFGLTMAELGPIGVIDNEGRHQWYTQPAPPSVPRREFPFDDPRVVRTDLDMLAVNPVLAASFAACHVVYLVQTVDLERVRLAVRAFNRDPDVVGIDIDSGSIMWDMLMSTRDTSDERKSMLSWAPVKEWDRLFKIGLTAGQKHCLLIAHAQDKLKMVKRPDGSAEFLVEKIVPRLEKYSGHWADIVVSFDMPDGATHPSLIVVDEGTGGAGGLRRGVRMDNPTFKKVVDRLGRLPDSTPVPEADVAYRNKLETQRAVAATQKERK